MLNGLCLLLHRQELLSKVLDEQASLENVSIEKASIVDISLFIPYTMCALGVAQECKIH